MSIIPTPRFETDRLILRPFVLNDIPTYQKNFNDYEVIKHLSAAVPWPYPDNGVEFFLNNVVFPHQGKTRWDWAIFLKTNPHEVIGSISFFLPGVPEHRGFWLAQKYWGLGLMTEAVAPIMEFAFNTLNMETVIFSNALGNDRSRRVKEKTGAVFKELKPMKFVDSGYTQSEYWELSRAAWEKQKSS